MFFSLFSFVAGALLGGYGVAYARHRDAGGMNRRDARKEAFRTVRRTPRLLVQLAARRIAG